ncbi:MAG: isocitrate lyase/PEP mutase family protein, partial [Verrucomicrobiota bacterium]
IFTGGFGISASLLGKPDIGLLSATEMTDRVRYICRAVTVPVLADMDTGYGNELNVMRTVEDAVAAGASGVILEDQEWPKRCGHFDGKRVIARDEHEAKIRAAVKARGDDELVIVARTDARSVLGLDEAMTRGRAYAEAGADAIFVEAPQSREELETIAEELQAYPLMANIIEGGKTPNLPVKELEAMGYKLCAFALSALLAGTHAMRETLRHLKEHGHTGDLGESFSFSDFAEVIGLHDHLEKNT